MKKAIRFQTISYKPGSVNLLPYIRITNKMLADYGFKYGDKIVIEYQQGKITIFTPEEYQKHEQHD